MGRILSKVNQKTTVGATAVLISVAYLASRGLGLLRDRLLASHFGASNPLTDAYAAAFRLPDLLFTLLVSGAVAVAFIPVLTEHWVKEERMEAWEIASGVLNILMLLTLVTGAVIFVFADPLTTLVAPGFDQARHEVTVKLTRIMLVTPFLFAVSSVLGSIQQSFGRFFFFSVASIFYNLGIIFGIIFLSPDNSIYGVAYGVVLGAFLQAAIQVFGLLGLGYSYRPRFNLRHKSVRKILGLMVPRALDQGIDQLNYTVQTIIGSGLATGSLTAFYYANNLRNVPIAIFGSAVAVASFPRLAARAASKNTAGLISDLVQNARLILFLVIPAATLAVLLRGYIVRLLFGFGDPTTASLLGWFAGSIIFQSLFFLVSRAYYAMQDTKTPLFVSAFAIALNIVLSFWLTRRYGVAGLPMAQSLVAMLETVVLVVLLRARLGHLGGRSIMSGLGKMLLANAIMASTVYILVAGFLPLYRADRGFIVVGPKFLAIAAAAAIAYLIPCYILQLPEAHTFMRKLKDQTHRFQNP